MKRKIIRLYCIEIIMFTVNFDYICFFIMLYFFLESFLQFSHLFLQLFDNIGHALKLVNIWLDKRRLSVSEYFF